jgi:ribosome-binding factor A
VRRQGSTNRDFPRTARLNRLLQQIIADEVEKLDDDRLGFLTIVAVEVDADLRHAVVYYSVLSVEDDDALREALAEHRIRLQAAVARQARLKRTPDVTFKADEVTRTALRVEGILRDLHDEDDAGS